jgi:hypothetical protein
MTKKSFLSHQALFFIITILCSSQAYAGLLGDLGRTAAHSAVGAAAGTAGVMAVDKAVNGDRALTVRSSTPPAGFELNQPRVEVSLSKSGACSGDVRINVSPAISNSSAQLKANLETAKAKCAEASGENPAIYVCTGHVGVKVDQTINGASHSSLTTPFNCNVSAEAKQRLAAAKAEAQRKERAEKLTQLENIKKERPTLVAELKKVDADLKGCTADLQALDAQKGKSAAKFQNLFTGIGEGSKSCSADLPNAWVDLSNPKVYAQFKSREQIPLPGLADQSAKVKSSIADCRALLTSCQTKVNRLKVSFGAKDEDIAVSAVSQDSVSADSTM